MQSNDNKKDPFESDESMFSDLFFKFLPYWPLFLFITLLCLASAYIYIRYVIPIYQVSANILIKDERKGMGESELLETLNPFGTSKIVENEIVILRSRTLMKEVVETLQLYAPVHLEGRIKSGSAYSISPVKIEVKNPDSLEEQTRLTFSVDDKTGNILFNKKYYKVNEWFLLGKDSIRFIENTVTKRTRLKDPLFFSLINVKSKA